MKGSVVFCCVADIIIAQLKYCVPLEGALHKNTCGLLKRDPEGGASENAKHPIHRVVLRCGCKYKGSCMFSRSTMNNYNVILVVRVMVSINKDC